MIIRYKNLIILLILPISIMLSCSGMLIEPDCPSDNLTVFKKFWDDMDKCYPFFDIKHEVDWDSVYKIGCAYFSPEREQMQTEEGIYNFYDSIIKNLYDPHISIVFKGFHWLNYYEAHSWAKGQEPDPFNSDEYMYEQNASIATGACFKDLSSFWDERIWFASISDSICFINIIDFHDSNFKDEKFDPLINELCKYTMCIIDMRTCNGGVFDVVEKFCSRLCTHDFVYGYEQCKDGYEHDNFKKPAVLKISASKRKKYTGEIILLINKKTVSGGELFALAMKESGRAKLIGDTTQGHFGSIVFRELPNGWFYTFSGDKVLDKNLICLEDIGVSPNYFIRLGDNSNSGIDKDFLLDHVLNYVNGVE